MGAKRTRTSHDAAVPTAGDAEVAENWALVNTPLGEEWSGRARYAAAMFFYLRGEMSADTLEVYRICSRLDAEDPLAILRDAYAAEPFVHVGDAPPETKWATGSNAAFLTARYDERTDMVVAIAAIDNLGKGAAGQMIQCANLMLGFDEAAGLPVAGVYP